MKVLGIPKSDNDSASTRIRYTTFLNALPPQILWEPYKKSRRGDVLYIQKALDAKALKAARRAYRHRVPVIFDMDDVRKDWASKPYDEMLGYATAVTTDTLERAAVISKHTDLPVHVVPDCIDYGISEEDAAVISNRVKNMVTFGHKSTLQSAVPYMREARKWAVSTSHICNTNVNGAGRHIKWSRKLFVEQLRTFDFAVLAHEQDWQGQSKSANRLLVCMALGLPCAVTDTLAYATTMKTVGFPELIMHEPSDIEGILKRASLEYRRAVSVAFRRFAFDCRSPEMSADVLAGVFSQYAGEKHDSH